MYLYVVFLIYFCKYFRHGTLKDIKEEDVNNICQSLPDKILSYIGLTVQIDLKNAIFTSAFQDVSRLVSHHTIVHGPKGCGKTHIITMMFCLCWLKHIPCLLLLSASLSLWLPCIEFCRLFVTTFITDKAKQTEILDHLRKGNICEGWELAIHKAGPLLIFADLVTRVVADDNVFFISQCFTSM